jgi:hypothetical protein
VPRPRAPRHALPARLPAALARIDDHLSDSAVRLVATAVAGLVLLSAGAAAGVSTAAAPASKVRIVRAAGVTHEVQPRPVALPARPVAHKPTTRPHAFATRTASAHAAAQRARSARPWLPTGTGMWLHEFGKSEHGNAAAVVAKARRAGLSTLYVRTGSSGKGWIGTPALTALLRATKGTGIRVVAWDFPNLKHPELDARRLATAAHFTCRGCARVAAVAPDVETASEGTRLSGPAVQRYYRTLRHRIGPGVAILATVPWPSENRTGRYPYKLTAALSDAILPMAYWYNRDPGVVTQTSMRYLKQFHRPVMPVGQGYDSRLDAPYLAADPRPGISVMAFLRTARAGGAQAVSLWSWQTAGPQQWHTLGLARTLFPTVGGRT